MSKFTWPTRIVVEAEVTRKVDYPNRSTLHPNLSWGSLYMDGQPWVLIDAHVTKIIEVEDQWHLHPPQYYVGEQVYVAVPKSEIRLGRYLKIGLVYEPDMQPQTGPIIVGQIVRPTFLGWLDAE